MKVEDQKQVFLQLKTSKTAEFHIGPIKKTKKQYFKGHSRTSKESKGLGSSSFFY